MSPVGRIRLALDHNFPEPILRSLDEFIVDVELVPIRRIDPRLPRLDDDRQLVIALHQLGLPGLVTSNYKMLKNPKELAAIMKTRVTVFAIEGVGDDPVRATGALLLDLPAALSQIDPNKSQVFWLRPRRPPPQDPWVIFTDLAQRRQVATNALYEDVKVTDEELNEPILT